jgi:hypothetical protein
VLVLDRAGVHALSERCSSALALVRALRDRDLWPPVVPSAVVAESLSGDPAQDADVLRFLRTCVIEDHLPLTVVIRAAELRRRAGLGTLGEAVAVAIAEPDAIVLTGASATTATLVQHSDNVSVEVVGDGMSRTAASIPPPDPNETGAETVPVSRRGTRSR